MVEWSYKFCFDTINGKIHLLEGFTIDEERLIPWREKRAGFFSIGSLVLNREVLYTRNHTSSMCLLHPKINKAKLHTKKKKKKKRRNLSNLIIQPLYPSSGAIFIWEWLLSWSLMLVVTTTIFQQALPPELLLYNLSN